MGTFYCTPLFRLGDYTREDFNSDLHRLSEHEPAFIHSVSQDEIDPLLQVQCHMV